MARLGEAKLAVAIYVALAIKKEREKKVLGYELGKT
jgi:hypothetical protein